jgi:hypothetical protein
VAELGGARPVMTGVAQAIGSLHMSTTVCLAALKSRLAPYGLSDCVALWTRSGRPVARELGDERLEDAGGVYLNDRRSGFLPFLDLPKVTTQPLELALCLGEDEEGERRMLEEPGWRVQDAHAVAGTPRGYHDCIHGSRREFSCAKPSCIRLQNAWISDRTLCHLASGKPAVVQHTGPSRLLPDAEGLFRFRDIAEASRYLEAVAADYEHRCERARALAEEHFDAAKVARQVLEYALA